MATNTYWRSPELGKAREIDVPGGRIRVFERGEGRPIVFVHGLLVNANLWRKVVPSLASDFRCITLDLPFGSHEIPMQSDVDLGAHGFAALIAATIENLGLEDVILVGSDSGGALTQIVATRHPERLGAIALCSCDSFEHFPPRLFAYLKVLKVLPGAAIPVLFGSLRIRALRRLPIAFGWLAKRPIDRDAEDSYVLPVLRNAAIRADVRKALTAYDTEHTLEAASKLAGFEHPALIAWSREDRVFPPKDAERLAAILPDARLEWIDDSYTFSPEDQPERLATLIGEFAAAPAAVAT
ncbi:MAG: alpha/beta fold hydrolase [Solirubrobacterales bacterium]